MRLNGTLELTGVFLSNKLLLDTHVYNESIVMNSNRNFCMNTQFKSTISIF